MPMGGNSPRGTPFWPARRSTPPVLNQSYPCRSCTSLAAGSSPTNTKIRVRLLVTFKLVVDVEVGPPPAQPHGPAHAPAGCPIRVAQNEIRSRVAAELATEV